MVTKNCRPLNLMNWVGKLEKKVVAHQIQDFASQLFHLLQYVSISGRSALDVLYQSVQRARVYIHKWGSLGLGFLDVKGGFQKVAGDNVLEWLAEDEDTSGLYDWVRYFVAPREFGGLLDGQQPVFYRDLLSANHCLVCMAPMLT